jgi:ankyrin repeat protein
MCWRFRTRQRRGSRRDTRRWEARNAPSSSRVCDPSLVLAHVDPDRPCYHRETPLLSATYRGKRQSLQALLESGADPDAGDKTTPLTRALFRGVPLEFAEVLLHYGADPDLVGEDGRTPLETAAYVGSPDAIDLLIGAGARLGTTEGWRALSWAVSATRIDSIDRLLKHGVDINARGPDGITVFQKFAGDQYRFQTVAHLIEAGADPDLPYPNGRTAIGVARMMSNWQLVELLTDRNEKRSNARGNDKPE